MAAEGKEVRDFKGRPVLVAALRDDFALIETSERRSGGET